MRADHKLYRRSATFTLRGAGGYTLIEVLLVVAIVATLGGLVIARISDAMHRTENANALQRKQAVYTAEGQYTIAAGGVPDTHQFTFQEIQPWLTINGNPVTAETDLMKNTGNRTINYGTPATGPTVSPDIDPQFMPGGSATGSTSGATASNP
jgi:prepilin-type N-terminal cleavage/methylation domain-containing protein